MHQTAVQVDSTPRKVARLPFASESGLQRFVEEHATELFGVEVVASALRGGGRILNIDILAVDHVGRPWIFECKHDLVDARAHKQLHRYRAELASKWPAVAQRLDARHPSAPLKKADPILVLIGYRYDHNFDDEQTRCFAYRYHDVGFTDAELQEQKAGRVSLHGIDRIVMPTHAHPKVSKKTATFERLERLAPLLAEAFWQLDTELQKLRGVKVKYGGKNFVRYRTRTGIFAEAVICPDAIRWRIKANPAIDLEHHSDVVRVLEILHEAFHQAG